uniref:AlNc14C1G34 protein n=1 Tax=Albugo laibachii Nc14 TaxID=890382 RepID=F0VYN2_9STRA|nr:AlNc14C1G34 [Albugo laibachii Nc14]|eukprot:CCA13896.1 AlNc14C1G34 [Albugo laibachii Nc14]
MLSQISKRQGYRLSRRIPAQCFATKSKDFDSKLRDQKVSHKSVHRHEEAVKSAPKKASKAADGATKEAEKRKRDEAISRGSMNQEAETTPIHTT